MSGVGEYIKEFVYIMQHVSKKICPICKKQVPKKTVICPNCGYSPPILGGFLDADEAKELLNKVEEVLKK